MTSQEVKIVESELKAQAKSFCPFVDACPYMSRVECTDCLRFFFDLLETVRMDGDDGSFQ